MPLTPKDFVISGKSLTIRKEAVCAAAITPGELLEYSGADAIQPHSTAAGAALALFAVENDVRGKDLDEDYASGQTVQMIVASPGVRIYPLLADGEDASVGSYLVSNGDGALRVFVPASDSIGAIVAQAVEAVDNSSGGAEARIRAEVV